MIACEGSWDSSAYKLPCWTKWRTPWRPWRRLLLLMVHLLQGSVIVSAPGHRIEPLFLIHIIDLPSVVTSHVIVFANDCLIYRPSSRRTSFPWSRGVIHGAWGSMLRNVLLYSTQNSYPLAAFLFPLKPCPFLYAQCLIMLALYATLSNRRRPALCAKTTVPPAVSLPCWARPNWKSDGWDVGLALLFKFVHGHLEGTTLGLNLPKADSHTWSNHSHKYRVKGSNTRELQNFFTFRTVPDWKNLLASIVIADSMDAF